jgi:hypothetical protein
MQQFIEKYGEQIQRVVSGFDRLVFRGSLRRLNYGYWDREHGVFVARGMEEYCRFASKRFQSYFCETPKWTRRTWRAKWQWKRESTAG